MYFLETVIFLKQFDVLLRFRSVFLFLNGFFESSFMQMVSLLLPSNGLHSNEVEGVRLKKVPGVPIWRGALANNRGQKIRLLLHPLWLDINIFG